MTKRVEANSLPDGLELGDLVLILNKSPAYSRVVKIVRIYAEDGDWMVRDKRHAVGDELTPHISVERVMNVDLTKPNRRFVSVLMYPGEYKKVDREFIKQIFRDINDELAYSIMIKSNGDI